MRYFKIMKFAVTAAVTLSLLFLTACGAGNDRNDTAVRISISPVSHSVEAGSDVELTVDAKNTGIKWPEQGAVEGSFTQIGGNKVKYRPPSIAGTYKFTVAAEADASKTVTAKITVVYADPQITISPANPPETKVGKTLKFTAATTIPLGQPQKQELLWEANDCGTIDQTGLFSAARAGDCMVKASLRNINNKKITESVTVKITDPSLDDIIGDMVEVRGGAFTMGCAAGTAAGCPEHAAPEHSVTLNTFYIGKYEVTQFLWKQIMGVYGNPSGNQGNNLPAENISWDTIQTFLERLNDRTGKTYRLPTEAEWEYAARGGSQSRRYAYSGSNTLDEVGWYADNSEGKTHPVGMKRANELGLYDMSGNVDEWVIGDSHSNPADSISDMNRIVRGGSNIRDEEAASVFSRGGCAGACDPNPNLGFRLAITSIR